MLFLLSIGKAIITIVLLCALVVSIVIVIKNIRKKRIISFCSVGVALSIVLLILNMYVFNQSFKPKFTLNNLSNVYDEFKEMYLYAEENKMYANNTFPVCNEYAYENNKIKLVITLNDINKKELVVQYDATVTGENDGVHYWCTDITPFSMSPFSFYIGAGGIIVLEKNNEILIIDYSLFDYKGASNIFPSYPKDFVDVSFLLQLTNFNQLTLQNY